MLAQELGPKFRFSDGDIEKLCNRCLRLYGAEEAWWPADNEFFSPDRDNTKAQLHSWCKACCRDARSGTEERTRENEANRLRRQAAKSQRVNSPATLAMALGESA